MKILHIVSGYLDGGAARGTYWLHQGLLNSGVKSKILLNTFKNNDDQDIETILYNRKNIFHNYFNKFIEQLPLKCYNNRQDFLFSTTYGGFDITKHPLYEWADIINLHWINDGFVNIKYLKKIRKPIVWTLRDMWPITGGCHYSMSCKKYELGCGYCPILNSNKKNDLSSKNIIRKMKYLPNHIHFVGISPWMTEITKSSYLFRDFNVSMINNNINLDYFFPLDKKLARDIMGIQTYKKIILIGAQYNKDLIKGFNKFLQSLNFLESSKYFIILFGRLNDLDESLLKFENKSIGFLKDNISLRILYSAADVFVSPSLTESFGKTIAESMACGTPAVCFDVTGQKYIVDHKLNGYKAKPYMPEDLANGIKWITDNQNYDIISQEARNKITKEFDNNVIALKYKDLYTKLLKNRL